MLPFPLELALLYLLLMLPLPEIYFTNNFVAVTIGTYNIIIRNIIAVAGINLVYE